jgi:hypothetical protein
MLDAKFAGRAVVTYAAPAFHTEQQLYRHTEAGTTAAHSTFPSPALLKNHKNWHYAKPGAVGVGCSKPTALEGEDLESRLSTLLGRDQPPEMPPAAEGFASDDDGWLVNLRHLSAEIREVVEAVDQSDTFRRTEYMLRTQEITADTQDLSDEFPWVSPFLKISAFSDIYKIAWLCAA